MSRGAKREAARAVISNNYCLICSIVTVLSCCVISVLSSMFALSYKYYVHPGTGLIYYLCITTTAHQTTTMDSQSPLHVWLTFLHARPVPDMSDAGALPGFSIVTARTCCIATNWSRQHPTERRGADTSGGGGSLLALHCQGIEGKTPTA